MKGDDGDGDGNNHGDDGGSSDDGDDLNHNHGDNSNILIILHQSLKR